MVFTNTLVTAHARARSRTACSGASALRSRCTVQPRRCWSVITLQYIFLNKSQCALFVVSLLELHSAVDLDVFCQNV